MKMNFPTGVVVGVAGLVIGFLSSICIDPAGRTDVATGARTALSDGGHARDSDSAAGDDGEANSLANLEERLRKKAVGPDIAGYMERLGAEEIRSLIEYLEDASRTDLGYSDILETAMHAAARELYRREGKAALEWGSSQGEQGKPSIFKKLVMAALEDSPQLAKPWVDIYQQKYAMIGEDPFREAAFRAASAKGVDAVLEARRVLGVGNGQQFVHGPLPDDFDFKRLLAEAPGAMGSYGAVGFESAVELWAGRDPDSAWKALMEIGGENPQVASRYLNSIFNGMSQTVGEDAAVKWMAGRLDDLPANLREQALFATMDSHDLRYQVVDKVLDGLPTDQDRVALAMGTVTPFSGDGPLDILRHLGSTSLQTDALVGAAKCFSQMASNPENQAARDVKDYFSKIITDLNLPPADRERVLETLRTPQDLFTR
jgi:hypothetical protein